MSVQIFITVLPESPTGLHYSSDTLIFVVNMRIHDDAPVCTGGSPSKFVVSSSLPPGLYFDTANGTISGIPTQMTQKISYLIFASNAGGTTETTITIEIVGSGNVTGPTIRFLSPARDSSVSSDNSMTVRIFASDSSGVATVTFSLNTTTFEGVNSSDTVWSATVSGLKAGFNRIVVSALDKSANANQSRDSIYVKYDSTIADNRPPIFKPIAGIISDSVVRQPSVTATFEVTDASGIDSVFWILNGQFVGLMAPVPGISNQYSLVGTLINYHANRVVLQAVDKSANRNRDSVVLTIDYNTAPTQITLLSPANADGVTEMPMPVTVSWSGGSDPDGDSVTYKVWYGLTQNKMTQYSDAGGAHTVQLQGLAGNRLYYWNVTGYSVPSPKDSVVSGIRSFGTFNTPPQVALQLPANGATRQPVDGLNLSWATAFGDGDSVTYSILVGTNRTLTLADQKVTLWSSSTYLLGGLQNGKEYYWRVVAKEIAGGYSQKSDTSVVDSFYTVNRAPVWNKPLQFSCYQNEKIRIPLSANVLSSIIGIGHTLTFGMRNNVGGSAIIRNDTLVWVRPYNYLTDTAISIIAKDTWPFDTAADTASLVIGMKTTFPTTGSNGMRHIPQGSYLMGQDALSTMGRPVTLLAFWIDSTEVTQADYSSVMGVNPSHFTGDVNRPVDKLTWFDAVLYCNARSKKAGLDTAYVYNSVSGTPGNGCIALSGIRILYSPLAYRLPTSAEWEYACRGGTETKSYWGDDTATATVGQYAWCNVNSITTTHPVAQKLPNAFGLFDMNGNSSEWCNDWAGDTTKLPQTDPIGPASGTARVQRGGAYYYYNTNMTSITIDAIAPDQSFSNFFGGMYGYGFRCVLPAR
jgi:formylglycine-generating enzyme required for sulfatase activity